MAFPSNRSRPSVGGRLCGRILLLLMSSLFHFLVCYLGPSTPLPSFCELDDDDDVFEFESRPASGLEPGGGEAGGVLLAQPASATVSSNKAIRAARFIQSPLQPSMGRFTAFLRYYPALSHTDSVLSLKDRATSDTNRVPL